MTTKHFQLFQCDRCKKEALIATERADFEVNQNNIWGIFTFKAPNAEPIPDEMPISFRMGYINHLCPSCVQELYEFWKHPKKMYDDNIIQA
jgi:hypothetical protein